MVKTMIVAIGLTLPLALLWWWLLPSSKLIIGIMIILFTAFSWALYRHEQTNRITRRDEEMYYWLQNFLTTLAVKKTITETFVDLQKRYHLMQQDWLLPYASNEASQALSNLKQRFVHPLYAIFVSTVTFYEQQGGDVMTLFDSILQQNRLMETRRITMHQAKNRYLFQWLFLWGLNLGVLSFAKLVLRDLFFIMEASLLFQGMLAAIFIWLPLSYHQWLSQWLKAKSRLR